MTAEAVTGASPAQRRDHPRAPLSVRVRYTSSAGAREGFISILGGGGVFIESVEPLPIDSEIAVEVQLPGTPDPVRARGRIVWVRAGFEPTDRSPGMGVAFSQISPQDRQRVVEVVMRTLMGKPLESF